MDYFKKLTDLLKIEREADHAQYRKLTEESSVSQRRANGLAWYPIAIRGQEMSRGDYLTVEVERTTHQDIPHQLRFGSPAVLFSNHDPEHDRLEGTISHSFGNRLKITLKTDELPDWSRDGKLGIDVLFDDNSYDEMFSAIKQADAISDKPEGNLIRVLTGEKTPTFQSFDQTVARLQSNFEYQENSKAVPPLHKVLNIPTLNQFQISAVGNILSANDLAIVHGPPGTGKTTTLVQAIKAMIERDNQKVLVVAPSNTAVDLLSEKLFEAGLNVLRVGNPAKVSDRLLSLTLDSKMAEHSTMKEIKRLKKQAQEFKSMAHKYKRNFGKSERDQRKLLFDEAHKIMKEVANSEQYIIDDVSAKAQVITATLVGSNHYTVRNLTFDTLVIDEAGQALEPACWIPILKAKKVVLAGDHCQLSPTVKTDNSLKDGLNITLLEKNIAFYPESVTLLEEQYRMHEAIMGYSSKVFYQDKLKAHASVAKHTLTNDDSPLLFIDTAGCGFEEKLEGTSSTNPEEAALTLKHLANLCSELSTQYTLENFPTVAVISPYSKQVTVLQEQILHIEDLKKYAHKISVNTIDSFQGQERDIVYISMTRSNDSGTIGFLSDIRRMNVAMTRARKKLVVIGDSATLAQFPFYADFIEYAEGIGGYKSAWEVI